MAPPPPYPMAQPLGHHSVKKKPDSLTYERYVRGRRTAYGPSDRQGTEPGARSPGTLWNILSLA